MESRTTEERVPALISYLTPFRIVEREGLSWECSLEQINNQTYDASKLARMVGSIDVGLPSPFCLHVGFDGALVLPLVPELLPHEHAAEFLNRFLAALTVGGINCDAIMPDDIETCEIIRGEFAWYFNPGKSFSSLLHGGLKYKTAGNIMSILLLEPQKLDFGDIVEAHFKGRSILSRAELTAPEFLIRGISARRRRSWNLAVAELWICIEQLTSVYWRRAIATVEEADIRGRGDMLKDHRTWTTAVRHEVLYQRRMLDKDTYAHLSLARKARNDLSHQAAGVTEGAAIAALNGALRLLSQVAYDKPDVLERLIPQVTSEPYMYRQPSPEVLAMSKLWSPIGGLANETAPK